MKVTEFLEKHVSLLNKDGRNAMKFYISVEPDATVKDMYNDLDTLVKHLKKSYSECTTRNYIRGIVKAMSLAEVKEHMEAVDPITIKNIMKSVEKDANSKVVVTKAEESEDDDISIGDIVPATVEQKDNKDVAFLKQRILDLEEQVAWLRKMMEIMIKK